MARNLSFSFKVFIIGLVLILPIGFISIRRVSGFNGAMGSVAWSYATWGVLYSSPALGDVDGDGQMEVVIGSWDNKIYCLSGSNGSLEWDYTTGGSVYSSPALGDINGDGKIEVIIGSDDGKVYCLNGDNGNAEWTYTTGGSVSSSPALGDVNEDGMVEVVFGSDDGKVYCLSGYSRSVEWAYTTGGSVSSSPALGDINGDGKIEVIIGSDDGKIYCLNGDNGNAEWTYTTGGSVSSSPALGDVNEDGMVEVVFGSDDGKEYCLRGSDGHLKWTYTTWNWMSSSPALGDVDGDGKIEVLVGSDDANEYCLNGSDGTLEWAYTTGSYVGSSAALGDVDGDGKIEVVFGSYDHKLYCLTGDGPSWGISGPWPMRGGSALRTANSTDSDDDGLTDRLEETIGTNPNNNDTDSDGLPDGWEIEFLLNPKVNTADQDPDGDGLINIYEYNKGTIPRKADTDGDGFIDGVDPAPLSFMDPTGYILILVFSIIGILITIKVKQIRHKQAERRKLKELEERARKEEEERVKYISNIKEHYPDKLEGTIEAIKKLREIAEYYMKNDVKGKVVECLEMEITLYKNAVEQAEGMNARTVVPTLKEGLSNVRRVLMEYRRSIFAEEHNRLKDELSKVREKEEIKDERNLLKAIEKNAKTYMDFLNRYGESEGLGEIEEIKSEVERALGELDVREAIKELNEGYNEIVNSIKNKDLTGASKSRDKLLKKVRDILNSLGNYNLDGEVLGRYEGALNGLERKLEGLGIKIEEALKSMIGGGSWSLSLEDYKDYKIEVGFSEIRGVSGSEFKRPLYAKVVLLGESSVGKTHLILSMTGREYKAKQGSTVGVDKYYKPVRTVFEDYDTELCFWDLGGQWNFRSVNSLFLNEASVVVLVFDVTRRETFEALGYWYKQVEYSRGIGETPVILVGNKIDVGGAAVLRDEVRSFCASAGLKYKYYETSAETGEGLDKLLEAIAGGVDWSVLIKSFDSSLAYRIGRELQELSKQFKILRKAKLLGELKSRMTGATDLELGTVLNYFASQDRLQFGRFSEYVILDPEYIDKRIGRLLTKAARNGGLISRSDLDSIFNLKSREQSDMISDYLEQENICYDTGGGSYLFPNVIHKKEVELDEHLLEVLNSSPLEGSIEFDGPGDLIFHQGSIALSRELGVPEFISNTAGVWKFGSGHKLSVLLIYYLKRKGGGLVQLKAGGGDPESLINTAQRVVNNIINMHTRKNLMF